MNFNLSHLILNNNLDYIVLTEIGRYRLDIIDNDRLLQQLFGNFMNQKLELYMGFNTHEKIPGFYQHGGTFSLYTGDLIGHIIN